MKTLIALLKREVLEHKNIWRVPLILVGIALLLRLSMVMGNLSINLDVPDFLQLDTVLSGAIDGVLARALNSMNFIIMLTMFIVAIFYTLSCLYDERQDQSVLFWRSLPISDSMTVASKLLIALVVVPLLIIGCQALVAVLFLGTDSMAYLAGYFAYSLPGLFKILLWSLLPSIAWCALCSEVAKKNPFLLAFLAPLLLILIDKLFLSGVISEVFVINRLTGVDDYTALPLILGLLFSAACLVLTVVKRSQRI